MAVMMYMGQILSGEAPNIAIDLHDRSLKNLAPSYLTSLLNQKIMNRLTDKGATYVVSNGGNTITAVYDDGCKEIMTTDGNGKYTCQSYSADEEWLETVVTIYNEETGEIRTSVSKAGSIDGIIPFADATFEQIAIMLKRHYAGIIDLSEFWSVGDTKEIYYTDIPSGPVGEVHIGTKQKITIIGFNHDDLTNGGKAALTLQFVNGMNDAGYVHRVNTNTGGWRDCSRRDWMNNVFVNALQEDARALIKPVDKMTGMGNKSDQIVITSDLAFLPSEAEVMGVETTKGLVTEGTQYAYFKNPENRKKRQNDLVSGYDNWWTRTPAVESSEQYVYIESDGDVHTGDASGVYRIVPTFCM